MKREFTNAFGKVYLSIETDVTNKWIYVTWDGYLSEGTVKSGALTITEAIRTSGFSCVLNDMQRVLGPVRSLVWAASEWAPEVARAGLQHMALVNAPEAIAAPDVATFHQQQTHLRTQVFTNLEEAKRWLKHSCQQTSSRFVLSA